MVFYLVRHGETDWNRENRLQGLEDIELNLTGVAQSHECAGALEGIKVDAVLSSPLKRALATAEIIAARLGLSGVIVERDLTERDFGRLSGLPPEEREKLLSSGDADLGVEPLKAVTARFMGVLNRYMRESSFKTLVVVSHGASINALLSHLSGGAIGTGKTVLKNACISRLACSGGSIGIDFYNLTPGEFSRRRSEQKGG